MADLLFTTRPPTPQLRPEGVSPAPVASSTASMFSALKRPVPALQPEAEPALTKSLQQQQQEELLASKKRQQQQEAQREQQQKTLYQTPRPEPTAFANEEDQEQQEREGNLEFQLQLVPRHLLDQQAPQRQPDLPDVRASLMTQTLFAPQQKQHPTAPRPAPQPGRQLEEKLENKFEAGSYELARALARQRQISNYLGQYPAPGNEAGYELENQLDSILTIFGDGNVIEQAIAREISAPTEEQRQQNLYDLEHNPENAFQRVLADYLRCKRALLELQEEAALEPSTPTPFGQ